jgi:transcription factor IIIB subunit 2
VLQDVQITQEITFGETSSGAAVVQGVYVGANDEGVRSSGIGNSKVAGGMDSRQVTERNGMTVFEYHYPYQGRLITYQGNRPSAILQQLLA